MSRLFKQFTVKPMPAGARVVVVRGEKVAKWTDAKGKEHSAFTNDAGDRIRIPSAKWYGEWRDANGILQREGLAENKGAAQLLLNERVLEAERGKVKGLRDDFAKEHKRPLAEHLADFGRHL